MSDSDVRYIKPQSSKLGLAAALVCITGAVFFNLVHGRHCIVATDLQGQAEEESGAAVQLQVIRNG